MLMRVSRARALVNSTSVQVLVMRVRGAAARRTSSTRSLVASAR